MSADGSSITAGPLKWSDMVNPLAGASKSLLDQALKRLDPRNEQVFATLYYDEGREIEEERKLGPWDRHLRSFAANAIDRVLFIRIESDELSTFHPFVL